MYMVTSRTLKSIWSTSFLALRAMHAIYVSSVSCFTLFQWGPCFGGGLWDPVSGESATGQIRGPRGRDTVLSCYFNVNHPTE